MASKPNTDIYQNRETISDLIREFMVPNMPMLFKYPFKEISTQAIIAKRKTYTADTDPKKVEPSLGGTRETAWNNVSISLGEQVPINTAIRKAGTAFKNSDLSNPAFDSDVRDVYTEMAWVVADQINSDIFAQLITGADASTTNITAKAGGAWSGAADPLGDIRAIAQDIRANRGFKLDTVVINATNYYEMFDNLETPDADMDYVREKVASQRQFYEMITYIKNIGCTVIGVDEGITESNILGIGTYMGTAAYETFSYHDPDYNVQPIADGSNQGLGAANIPLNVNTFDSVDGFEHNVYSWVDSVTHVARPKGILYKTGVI
jgi:hypothetical protein